MFLLVEQDVRGVKLVHSPHQIDDTALIALRHEIIVEVQPAVLLLGVTHVGLVVATIGGLAHVVYETYQLKVVRFVRFGYGAE